MRVVRSLALLCFLASCSDSGGELRIDLRTDWVPLQDFVSVRTRPVDTRIESLEQRVDASSDFVIGERIASYEGLSRGQTQFVIELLRDDGSVLAGRPLSVQVARSVGVTVQMTRDCVDVECPLAGDSLVACVAEMCVDPGCTPETPELCPPAECSEEGCPINDGCRSAACIEGVCFDTDCQQEPCDADSTFSCLVFDEPIEGWTVPAQAEVVEDGASQVLQLAASPMMAPRLRFEFEPAVMRGPLYARTRIRVQAPAITGFVVLLEYKEASAEKISFGIESGGSARLTGDPSSTFDTGGDPFPLDEWSCVELFIDVADDPDGSAWIAIDGERVAELNDVSTLPSGGINRFLLGPVPENDDVVVRYDDVLIGTEAVGCPN